MIHSFTGGVDGAIPNAGVTIKGDTLYGTTYVSAANGGAVYEIKNVGNDWITVPIFRFFPSSFFQDSWQGPKARVVFGPDDHLYGTTYFYGERGFTFEGTVFDLTAPPTICKTGTCPPLWTRNVLHTFNGSPSDGYGPEYGDLVWDQQGNIYGTTPRGGYGDSGTVYELMPPTPPKNTWTESVVYSFTGLTDGGNPYGGVIADSSGNLFGTTYGDVVSRGNVFELSNDGGKWTETILYNFELGSSGNYPIAGLISDSSGNLYGATTQGGTGYGGTVFELVHSGDTYIFEVICNFPGAGEGPWGNLAMDPTGNLYGTTYGGISGNGNVFKLTNTGNGWVYTSLHEFTGGSDGARPISNVTLDANGNLYGTASHGGNTNCDPPLGWLG